MASRIKPLEPKKASAPAYIVSLSALWTIMLTFFIMICTMANEQKAGMKGAGTGSFVGDMKSAGRSGLMPGTRNAIQFGQNRADYGTPRKDIETGAGPESSVSTHRPIKPDDERLENVQALPQRPVLLRIPTGVTFKPGSFALNWEARRELDSVLRRIRGTSRTITTEAYLDPVASFAAPPYFPKFGWVLSAQRARAVAEYFHSRGEVPYERLVSVGYSSYRPLAMGDTEAAHAVNDRVVVVIYDE